MSRDAVVVGGGLAGLVAAIRLAEGGLAVTVYAAGHGALPLSPAVIDVLGYGDAPVTAPASALPGFLADHPSHPLARLGPGVLAASCEWFLRLAAPLGYQGSLERNLFLPTAVGALRPTAMVPETMAAGDLSLGGSVLIVGIRGYRDFYAHLVAANLSAVDPPGGARIRARAVEVRLPGEAPRPQLLARSLEEREVRAELASAVRSELAGEEAVGLPAVLGLQHSREVWSYLQERIGRPVFEIPSLPPSISGLRLQALLLRSLRAGGGSLVVGAQVVGARAAGGRVTAVVVAEPSRQVEVSAEHFVLATGGVASGGIVVDRGQAAREVVFGLPVGGAGAQADPATEYFGPQPADRLGLSVDPWLRPVGTDGEPVYSNLHAAGALLGGAEPWREQSGNGTSLATGYAAAAAILGELS